MRSPATVKRWQKARANALEILLVENDSKVRGGLAAFLRSHGFEVTDTDSAGVTSSAAAVVVTGHSLPEEVLRELVESRKLSHPGSPVIVLVRGSMDLPFKRDESRQQSTFGSVRATCCGCCGIAAHHKANQSIDRVRQRASVASTLFVLSDRVDMLQGLAELSFRCCRPLEGEGLKQPLPGCGFCCHGLASLPIGSAFREEVYRR